MLNAIHMKRKEIKRKMANWVWQYSKHVIYGVVNHSCTIRSRISFIFAYLLALANTSLLFTLHAHCAHCIRFCFVCSPISFYFWTALKKWNKDANHHYFFSFVSACIFAALSHSPILCFILIQCDVLFLNHTKRINSLPKTNTHTKKIAKLVRCEPTTAPTGWNAHI